MNVERKAFDVLETLASRVKERGAKPTGKSFGDSLDPNVGEELAELISEVQDCEIG
jgi:hypothetical protein